MGSTINMNFTYMSLGANSLMDERSKRTFVMLLDDGLKLIQICSICVYIILPSLPDSIHYFRSQLVTQTTSRQMI